MIRDSAHPGCVVFFLIHQFGSRQRRTSTDFNVNQEFVMQDQKTQTPRFNIVKLEDRIAPSSANFPPGQMPSGNPAHAPGNSNPNEVPSDNPSND
jgi:hypothetical protein